MKESYNKDNIGEKSQQKRRVVIEIRDSTDIMVNTDESLDDIYKKLISGDTFIVIGEAIVRVGNIISIVGEYKI